MSKTAVLPKIDPEVTEPDGKAHYVRTRALMMGGPITALCGKRYIPSILGAEVMDRKICPPCAELYEMLGSMYG